MSLDLITENENKLELYWQHYKKWLGVTHNADCDEQEFIELGKAANQWRLQKELVEKLKKINYEQTNDSSRNINR